MKGKAKTLKLFLRKAKDAGADKIRAAALATVARERANKGGQYLPGLVLWLNGEAWDTGEPLSKPTTLTEEEKLYALETFGRWDADWGPRPQVRERELFS
jgi:hypothetical protein